MKILLTNDDGVTSSGIRILSRMLAEREILEAIIAPDRERSGCGHAMTMNTPVRTMPLDPGMFTSEVTSYSCDGTPTDCVNLGLDLLFPHADFVVSGINQGSNMGDDITYSGTVCAAMEAVILGRPAIAVSLCCDDTIGFRHNTTAAAVAMTILEYLEEEPLPPSTFLNINVPNLLIPQIKGFQITRSGTRRYTDKFKIIKDPHGKDCYWIGGRVIDDPQEGTDIKAIADGFVSITPIRIDMTDHDRIAEMSVSGYADKLFDGLKHMGTKHPPISDLAVQTPDE